MPKVDHGKEPEDTLLLEVKPGGTQQAIPVLVVPDLLGPQDRERGARSGVFVVGAPRGEPSDYERFARRFSL